MCKTLRLEADTVSVGGRIFATFDRLAKHTERVLYGASQLNTFDCSHFWGGTG